MHIQDYIQDEYGGMVFRQQPCLHPLDELVKPFCFELLNGHFCSYKRSSLDSAERLDFEAEFSQALDLVVCSDVEQLFQDKSWRTQLMASWYCAIKGWNQFQNTIISALLDDCSHFPSEGYFIALYSFADELSVACLCEYLEKWPKSDQLNQDRLNQQALVMQTLLLIDQKTGSNRAIKYKCDGGLWHRWAQSHPGHPDSSMAGLVGGLDYLRELDALPHNDKLRLLKHFEKSFRRCTGCNARLYKHIRHCKLCRRVEE